MGTTLEPSQNAWRVNSSPSSFSSMTMPVPPPIRLDTISSAYASTSSSDIMCSPKTLTPLPPVRPTGFTTISVPSSSSAVLTSSKLAASTNFADPFTLCLFMRFLM
jgi:hypothetical protein